MKFLLFILLPLSLKAQQFVDCRIANAANCHNCQSRILADCSDTNNSGAFEKSLKPEKVILKISNHKNGTEKNVIVKNTKLNLGDLQSSKKLTQLAASSGNKLKKHESIELYQVQIPMHAKFFKTTTGTEIASLGSATPATRNIASEGNSISKVGGVDRAQKLFQKESK